MASTSPESAPILPASPNKVAVLQPPKLREFFEKLQEATMQAESSPEMTMGKGGGSGTTTGQQQGTHGPSPRDIAIANLPPLAIMQQKLTTHIRGEVRTLRREAHRVTRVGKPGAAYHLNQLYARIRRLNALLSELLEASLDVLKRLFIRVFIDKQAL